MIKRFGVIVVKEDKLRRLNPVHFIYARNILRHVR